MSRYRYYLKNKKKKQVCPRCNERRYVQYFDRVTNEYLPNRYGRCDREVNCAYHINPYEDGYLKRHDGVENEIHESRHQIQAQPKSTESKSINSIPVEILKDTRTGYEKNIFIQNLLKRVPYPFPEIDVAKIISQYHLGTNNNYLPGMVTFPFIDFNGNIRAIQVKQFDETNHTTKTSFIHSILEYQYEKVKKKALPEWLKLYIQNEKYVTCLFGEHLLKIHPENPVALVEAPKTAVIATLCLGFPDESPNTLLWLGVYNLSSLNAAKCETLRGRKVYLFPDLNAYQIWKKKAEVLSKEFVDTSFTVSDFLERNASKSEKTQGLDLADYLLRYDYSKRGKFNPISS